MRINPSKGYPTMAFGCQTCLAAERSFKSAHIHPSDSASLVRTYKKIVAPDIDFCQLPNDVKNRQFLFPIFNNAELAAYMAESGFHPFRIIQEILATVR